MLNNSAFVHLRNSVEQLMAEGTFPPGDSTATALGLWTVAHGVAAMMISRPYLPWGDVEEFADRMLRSVVTGQIMSGAIGSAAPRDAVVKLKGLLDEQRDR